ncbi:MAG: hypothetical protein ISQ14_07030 [Verrucomicrobiae bacterium]|jgi:hypothetical protein|nr:hypothetical protein [Verrucomicrobiae bacterium]
MVDVERQADPARRRIFKTLAALLPSLIGCAAVVALLIHQERLVVDLENGIVRFQTPPTYLEEPGHEVSGHRYLYDAHLGWRNIPSWKSSTHGRTLTINSKGLRDREYRFERTPGVPRMLVLGDSFTWGYGVSDEEIFTEVMEQAFTDAGTPWEVVNSGVSGWGTDQEYLFLRREGFRYRPDLLILAFYVNNDPLEVSASVTYGMGKPYFASTNLGQPFPPTVASPGEQIRWLENRQPLAVTLALVGGIQEECRKLGAQMVLMKFGVFGHEENPIATEFSTEFLAATRTTLPEISILDLDLEFSAAGLTHEQVFNGNHDRHWNAFGHRFVADALRRHLVATGLAEVGQGTPGSKGGASL